MYRAVAAVRSPRLERRPLLEYMELLPNRSVYRNSHARSCFFLSECVIDCLAFRRCFAFCCDVFFDIFSHDLVGEFRWKYVAYFSNTCNYAAQCNCTLSVLTLNTWNYCLTGLYRDSHAWCSFFWMCDWLAGICLVSLLCILLCVL